MNKITEKRILPIHEVFVNGHEVMAMPLHFELICGALSKVPEKYSTLWRKMPFHMVSLSPDLPDASSAVMRVKGGEEFVAERQSILFMPANIQHRIDDYGKGRNSLWIHFRILAMQNFDFISYCNIKPFVCMCREKVAEVEKLLWKILKTAAHPESVAAAAWLQFYGMHLAALLFDLSGVSPENIERFAVGNKSRLLPALRIMEKSPFKPDIESLAAAVHLSPSRFMAIFREEIGCSPGKYFRQIQITRACKMLSDPAVSIAECSDRLGFADAFHFSREFHKFSGLSPSDYRKQLY